MMNAYYDKNLLWKTDRYNNVDRVELPNVKGMFDVNETR